MGLLEKLGLDKKTKTQLNKLSQLNQLAGGVQVLQAAIIMILADKSLGLRPVSAGFLTPDAQTLDSAGHPVLSPAIHHLFDINLAYTVAAFLLVAAAVRLGAASTLRRAYEKDLKNGYSRLRWFEFGLAGGLIMVTLALVNGVTDLSAIILIFGFVVAGAFLNYEREIHTHDSKTNAWWARWGGIKTSLAPWVVIAIYLWGGHAYGQGLPAYIYWLDGSLFVSFLVWAWAVDQSAKARGWWADYLNTEQAYLIISLVTSAALAWQIYGGVLSK